MQLAILISYLIIYLLKRASSQKNDRAMSKLSFQRVQAYHVEPEALDSLKRFQRGNLVTLSQYIYPCYLTNLGMKGRLPLEIRVVEEQILDSGHRPIKIFDFP